MGSGKTVITNSTVAFENPHYGEQSTGVKVKVSNRQLVMSDLYSENLGLQRLQLSLFDTLPFLLIFVSQLEGSGDITINLVSVFP